ncbi:hypothetical protein CW354_03295 [Marinicaulis flavus]|uniref:Uncharacterized protein n=1 Tax=Hyphococcus luteus TaxID=2058213 RepID=A0A2S7K931_9PROT|nr:hypothetical protein CW354_03295 [Marinicaulis flavus]
MAARCRGALSAMLAETLFYQGTARRQGAGAAGETGPTAAEERRRRRSGGVRFVAILVLLVLAGLIGLFVYGQMMEPDLHEIEVEANHAAQ